jgi:hypothetical protein
MVYMQLSPLHCPGEAQASRLGVPGRTKPLEHKFVRLQVEEGSGL